MALTEGVELTAKGLKVFKFDGIFFGTECELNHMLTITTKTHFSDMFTKVSKSIFQRVNSKLKRLGAYEIC